MNRLPHVMMPRPPAGRGPLDLPPATILVFTSSDLVGDGLIKFPFVRALRRAFPTARITWVTGNGESEYAGVLAPLVKGFLDEVLSNARIGLGWRQLWRRPLDGRHFDLVLDIQRRVVASLHIRRVPHRVFVSGAMGFLLSDLRPERPLWKPPLFIDQLLRLVTLVSGQPADPSGPLPLPPEMRAAAERLLPPAGGPYVGFAIGARGVHKCWPRENFVTLARRLAARGAVPVFLLGPMEAAHRDAIAAAVPAARFPLQDAAARPFDGSPLFTIALARCLDAAVANDCGTGHMIAVGGVPMVSLFGPTSPEKFAPASPRLVVIRAQDFGGAEIARIPVVAVEEALLGTGLLPASRRAS